MDDSIFHFHCFSTLNSQMSEEPAKNEEHPKDPVGSNSSTSFLHDDQVPTPKKCFKPSSPRCSLSKPPKIKINSVDLQKIKTEVSAIRKHLVNLKFEPIKRKKKVPAKFIPDKNCCGDFEDVQDDSKKFSLYEAGMIDLYDQCARSLRAIEKNRHKICEILQHKAPTETFDESKSHLTAIIDEKTKQLDELSKNYQQVRREKEQYQSLCEELTAKVEQFEKQMEERSNEDFTEELEKKQEVIEDLSNHIAQLREHICECDKITEEKEDLEEKYNKLLVQNKVLHHKLKKSKEGSSDSRFKSLEMKHERLMDMQSRILAHTDRLRHTVEAKNQFIAELKSSCQEKDSLIRKHKSDLVEIFKATSKTTTNSEQPVADGSCLNLSKELEALINSLYAEIDRSLLNNRLVEEQFEQNYYLKCKLAHRENEMALMRSELDAFRHGLMMATVPEHQEEGEYYEYEKMLPPYEQQCYPCCSAVHCCWVEQDIGYGM